MEKNYKITKSVKKTKSGVELGKIMHIIPLQGKKIHLKDLNSKIYKSLLTKFDVLDINIRAKTPDGMKTLKSFDFRHFYLIRVICFACVLVNMTILLRDNCRLHKMRSKS